ncbi:MAG: outer membrane beta-barrel protein [Desulfobacteraceae bacterium]|nr:outer membrane beta-barrel protein [Desulfobacteraceae bacterium]
MKKILFCSLIIFALTASSPAFSESLFSFSGGSFTPKEDFMSEFDTGYTFAATYTRNASDMFAYGIDVAFSQTEATADLYGSEDKVTLSTLGLEALIYIQPKDARVQPYVGIGLGLYGNNITGELNDVEYYDESGSAVGFIGKAGVRLFLDNKFFVGGYAKYYTNDQEFEYYNGDTETKNIGGTCFMFEIGAKL